MSHLGDIFVRPSGPEPERGQVRVVMVTMRSAAAGLPRAVREFVSLFDITVRQGPHEWTIQKSIPQLLEFHVQFTSQETLDESPRAASILALDELERAQLSRSDLLWSARHSRSRSVRGTLRAASALLAGATLAAVLHYTVSC